MNCRGSAWTFGNTFLLIGDHLQDHLIMPVIFETAGSSNGVDPQPNMRDLTRWEVMARAPCRPISPNAEAYLKSDQFSFTSLPHIT